MVEVKGNIKPKTDVNKYTEYGKNAVTEQIMVKTNESKKAGALWQTLRLYTELLRSGYITLPRVPKIDLSTNIKSILKGL